MRPSLVLEANRDLIRDLTTRHKALNPRVFGSVARGEDREDSDLDIVVDLLPETTLLDLGGLQYDLQDKLGIEVHLVSARGLQGRMRDRILGEAKAV